MIDRDERGQEAKEPRLSDEEIEALPLAVFKSRRLPKERKPRPHKHHYLLCKCWVSNWG